MALVIHSIEHSTDHSTEHSIEHSIERFIEHSTEPQGSLSLVVEVLILVCVSNRCAAAAARVARPSATSSCAATESVHAHARAAAMCASGSAARESALRAPKCATGSCRAATTSARHFPFKHTCACGHANAHEHVRTRALACRRRATRDRVSRVRSLR